RVDRLTERPGGSGARTVRTGRLPLMPPGGRKQLLDIPKLLRHARRRNGFGEDAQARAVIALLRPQGIAQRSQKCAPGADFALESYSPCAIRIVELQDRGLGESIACAQAGGVFGVAFDLRRPPFVALGQHSGSEAA